MTTSSRWWALVAALGAALLLVASCSGGDEPAAAVPGASDAGADSSDVPSDAADAVAPLVDRDPRALDGPAEVVVDVDGIPHVYAATDADAFFLQGWVTARHRLYQMDLVRRRALGRRAEILGEKLYASDLQSRALRFGDWGRRTREALETDDPELLSWFEAYAAGVNAWLATAKADGLLPPQFAALGYEPEPWTADDSLAIEKLIAAGLSMRPDQDITLGLIDLLLGADLFDDLYRYPPFDREYVVPGFPLDGKADDPHGAPADPARAALRASSLAAARARLAAIPKQEVAAAIAAARALDLSGGGSNNWAISGAHTASGAPILASDSHQGVEHPAVYYLVHLSTRAAGGSLDVIGASFPGTPFVVFGHNGTAAFAPTTSIYDVADAYLEELGADGTTVQYEGKAVPIEVRQETIRVRGAGAVADAEERTVTLRDVPHHGPMLPPEALGLPVPLQISIRWTGYRPLSLGRAFHGMDTAASFDDLRAALDLYGSGGMHWVYADTAGHIGYSSRVDLPVREVVDPAVPPVKLLPGGGGYEWLTDGGALRLVDRERVPWVLDPQSGFVGTANNDPVGQTDDGAPFDAPVYISGVFDIGTRALRPRVLFEEAAAKGPLTLDDVGAMQLDTWSRLGERMRPYVLDAAARRPDLVTPPVQAALDVLAAWDLRCDTASAGAVVFQGWLGAFARTVLSDEGGGLLKSVVVEDLDARIGLVVIKFLMHWLDATAPDIDALDAGTVAFPSKSGADFWDDHGTPAHETRDEAILAALGDAVAELTAIFGAIGEPGADPADPATWRWGRWHTLQLVDRADAVLPAASSAALPKAGCLYTVDVADHRWLVDGKLPEQLAVTNAPSNRFLFELRSDGVVGRAILPGGQDERPGAPHHNDQLADYLAGVWRPLRFTRAEVEAAVGERLPLPAGWGAD